MELAFNTKSLRQICESEDKAKNDLGPEVAEKLKARLEDLHATASVKDLVVGRPRQLGDVHDQRMVVDLTEGYGIVFSANHVANPTLDSGDVDWSRVRRIKIMEIEPGHDEE